MKILQYNILEGCKDDPARLARLGQWLKKRSCDVVGLNELNGWDQPPSMAQRARAWGYPYSELFIPQRSHHYLGVLSKHPIRIVRAYEKPFHHGALHVRIKALNFIITHLTPVDVKARKQESAFLKKIAAEISGPLVLMGDMNMLSPLDRQQHRQAGLVRVCRADPVLKRKFLAENETIDYDCMAQLLGCGLIDLCSLRETGFSVPTPSNQDRQHAVKMRLDYILVNQAFIARRRARAQVIRDKELDALSDHYPVECVWREEAARQKLLQSVNTG